jgi:hypothetical protein
VSEKQSTLADRLLLRNHIALRIVLAAVALAVVNNLPIINVT